MPLSAIALLVGAAPAHAFLIITGTPTPTSYDDFTFDEAGLTMDLLCAVEDQQCSHTLTSLPTVSLPKPTVLSLEILEADAVFIDDSDFYTAGSHVSGVTWEVTLSLPAVYLPLAPQSGSGVELSVDVWSVCDALAPLLPSSGHLLIDDSHSDADAIRSALLDSMTTTPVP